MEAFKIGRSRAASFQNYEDAVVSFAVEMTAWRDHMAKVGADPEKYQPYPRPQAHPDIVSAVSAVQGDGGVESYAPSFEIFDDGPSAEQVARAKRAAIANHIMQAERAAVAAVVPANKLRLLNLRIAAVRKRDSERHEEIVRKHHEKMADYHRQREAASEENSKLVLETSTRLARGAGCIEEEIERVMQECHARFEKIGDAPTLDPVAACCAARPKEDHQLLTRADTIQADINAIELHAAELLDEVEDLAPEALDGWVMRPFPEPTKV